jgi:2-polyprenyl-6-methoxyphenol hydroxylase-like FAD-dependent oxidoreductase
VPVSNHSHRPGDATDVAIVGAGIAGSLAAIALARQGFSVRLFDRNVEIPPDFRVEKLGGDQIELLKALDVFDSIAKHATPFNEVVNVYKGRVLDKTHSLHLGILYKDIVGVLRGLLPGNVGFTPGRVTKIANGPAEQQIVMQDGSCFKARLVVLATGLSDVLRDQLGVRRITLFEQHSISFGFDIVSSSKAFACPSLTYYGERIADCIDYLSVFPIGPLMRANLFTFRDLQDPWLRDMRRNPKETLLSALPQLETYLPGFEIRAPVQNWVMDLYATENYRKDGLVLIGDSFQTSCPAAGTGVSRLLNDVVALVHCAPLWLASPGMTAEKIGMFYDDRGKKSSDRRAMQMANYRRSLTVDESLRWSSTRKAQFMRRRIMGWLQGSVRQTEPVQ